MNDKPNSPTCGTCQHFRQNPQEPAGSCWFWPPVPFASGERRRPPVRATETCGQHKALAPGEPPKVNEKVKPKR